MPELSNRGKNAYQSPIRTLVPYADAAKKEGVKIYHLNIGQPDLETPAMGMDKIKTLDLDIVSYSPSKGIPSYVTKLTAFYNRYGYNLSEDDVFVTVGASEAVTFALMACADQGDEIIIPEPFYANYTGFAEMAGLNVVPISTKLEENFAMPDMTVFENAIGPKTKAIFICNPGNPTGKVFTEQELIDLAALCKKHNLFFIIDEVYRDFCYDGHSFHSGLSLQGMENYVVVIDSISKRFSACGARVGSIISRNKQFHTIVMKYAQLRLSSPTFGQILAEGLTELPSSYFNTIRAEYDERRRFLVSRLSAMKDVTFNEPAGAFYVMAKLPIPDTDHFCKWLLEHFRYNNKTIMLAPGAGFFSTPKLGKNLVRIAYILNKHDLGHAMDCLEQALLHYPQTITLDRGHEILA